MAMVMRLTQEDNELCGICFARLAIGTFNVDDVEYPLCSCCSVYRNADNTQVIIPTESV
jgi:hypothetical protein